jgi:hypothetical protein
MAGASTAKAPEPTPVPEPKAAPVLRSASESTDPTVHYLIAVRDALSRGGGDCAAVTAQLAELGYQ